MDYDIMIKSWSNVDAHSITLPDANYKMIINKE